MVLIVHLLRADHYTDEEFYKELIEENNLNEDTIVRVHKKDEVIAMKLSEFLALVA